MEQVISTKFHSRYKGGLLQWIQDYENAFAELVSLSKTAWKKDNSKKRCILQNAKNTGLNPTVMQTLTKTESFEEVCNILRSHEINQEEYAKENVARKVHNTNVAQTFLDLFANMTNTSNADVNTENTLSFTNLIGQMPMDLWEKLPKEVRYWLIQE